MLDYSHIHKSYEVSKDLISVFNRNSADEVHNYEVIVALILLEQVIEKQRRLVDFKLGFEKPEDKREMESQLDELRGRIAECIAVVDKDELKQYLDSMAFQLKTNFLQ